MNVTICGVGVSNTWWIAFLLSIGHFGIEKQLDQRVGQIGDMFFELSSEKVSKETFCNTSSIAIESPLIEYLRWNL